MSAEPEEPTREAADAPSSPAPRPFMVVALGASAGGLEAIVAMLERLTLDSMAFVVVQHLSPSQESHLTELLARATALRVVTATDGARIEPNTVYVVPPGVNPALMNGVMHLMPLAPEQRGHTVDLFFRSLAKDRGPLGVGVVLSGTGSDGALGLKAIKAEGGLTFVQRPSTARFEGMPQSALDRGAADFCLAPEEIADELMALSRHPYLRPERPARAVSSERLSKVLVLLRDAFGHDLTLYKTGTIERRVERRMVVHKIERIENYVAYLQSNPAELATLYHDLLIGVTSFFRDPESFEALKEVVFPQMLQGRKADETLRVWVPGCSTGEEAYSIAIALLEHLGDRAPPHRLQVFATDVDEDSVQAARRGAYSAHIAADVSPERLQRFFVPRKGGFQVGRRLRDAVVFATQNVARDPPFSHLDLVSCRNLLIYFQSALQKTVLRVFHYALVPDGHLLLGGSETVGDSADLFSLVERRAKLYRKKNLPVRVGYDISLGEAPRVGEVALRPPPETRPMANVQQLADRKILERFGPPGVVINEAFEVLQFRGKTGPYLEPLPGMASLNLFKLARPEVVGELRAAVHRALETGAPAAARGVTIRSDGGRRAVDLEVLPIVEPETRGRCFVVLFLETEQDRAEAPPSAAEASAGRDPRVDDLERELSSTREYLQTLVEELETSNEELQSANEEMQSANEELQSTNEELETSKEELQAANEELTTVNDELHSRMAEHSESHDDLQNLLGVIEAPIVIVGLDLRIRRFTHAAEQLLNLLPADVGRLVSKLSWFAPTGTLERMIGLTIERLVRVREDLTAAGGRRYRVSAVPYKTADHVIRGAVLTFFELDAAPVEPDPTERKEERGGPVRPDEP